ncbi:hypothetical protein [Pseudonocardia sp. GCM10023141]|uniref:hypothetical protein n=1 Tax=Pseudonocardia sp. GCM10023141 TaxID=3252653 RepID=UPI003618B8D1
MNGYLVLAISAGAVLGLGVAIMIAAFMPSHPRLGDALAALDERLHRPPLSKSAPRSTWLVSLLVPWLRQLPGAVMDADLELLGIERDRFLLHRAGTALAYAVAGPVLGATLAVLDAGIGFTVPAVFSIAGAVVGWNSAGAAVGTRAERGRMEMRFALVSYLQQVSLLRFGGAGVATALTVPARLLSDSWAMRRLHDELDLAERAGEMPWEGIRRFGQRIDLTELADVSSIAATAGQDGGAVVTTLLARAESLRDELLADEQADANRASGQLSTPGAVQVFVTVAWVLYPVAMALLTSA